ncbi:unnamed protein product [Arctogadus glacialis]
MFPPPSRRLLRYYDDHNLMLPLSPRLLLSVTIPTTTSPCRPLSPPPPPLLLCYYDNHIMFLLPLRYYDYHYLTLHVSPSPSGFDYDDNHNLSVNPPTPNPICYHDDQNNLSPPSVAARCNRNLDNELDDLSSLYFPMDRLSDQVHQHG